MLRPETSRGPEDIRQVLACLIDWLQEPAQRTLRRAFAVWMRRVLLPARIPGVELAEFEDIREVQNMLAERVKKWTEEWKQQGLEQGLERGITRGEAQIVRRQLVRRFGRSWILGRGNS